jgi:hypothetical protein
VARTPTRDRVRLFAYVALVAMLASALAIALLLAGYRLKDPLIVLALALVAALSERSRVRFTPTLQQSVSHLPTLFSAVILGPLAAGVVSASSMLGDPEVFRPATPGRDPRLKLVAYTSSCFVVGVVMGLAADLGFSLTSSPFGGIVAATMLGAVLGETLDTCFAAVTARVRGRRMIDTLQAVVPILLTSTPIFAPIVAVLAVAYLEISPWTAPLFFVPALAAQRLYMLYQEQRILSSELRDANEHLERANLSFAAALVATLDARDRYTAGHSAAVAIYSRDIAARMGLPALVQDTAYLCGLVHDIGKIGLPPGLLEKPGALTLEERLIMQEHSAIGERILANVDGYGDTARIVRHHHERIDGQGYPDGIAGEAIPLLSRIIAVADAYNAMTSDRPYRDAMPSRVARLRLAQGVETQFDTSAVTAFEAILAGADEEYRTARRPDFLEFAQSQPPEWGQVTSGYSVPEVVAGAA